MTSYELRAYFNNNYGISQPWPKIFEVDAETYGYVCDEIFHYHTQGELMMFGKDTKVIRLGPNGGIMFKNVELVIKK